MLLFWTTVWVTNRDNLISGPDGMLALTETWDLLHLDGRNITMWTSNTSERRKNHLCSSWIQENLLLGTELIQIPIPTYGKVSIFCQILYCQEWRSCGAESPAKFDTWLHGELTYGLEHLGIPQIVPQNGLKIMFHSGPCNGLHFCGFPMLNNRVFKPCLCMILWELLHVRT